MSTRSTLEKGHRLQQEQTAVPNEWVAVAVTDANKLMLNYVEGGTPPQCLVQGRVAGEF